MKLKYYLRGIAIGIIFTITVMILTGVNKKQNMSDSEIIHAAKNLGMVEPSNSVTITGIAPTKEPDDTTTPASESTVLSDGNITTTPVPANEEKQGDDPTQGIENSELSPGEKIEEDLGPAAPIVVTATPTVIPEATAEPTKATSPEPTATPEPTIAPKPFTPPNATDNAKKPSGTADKEDTVTLTVVKGMYSEEIAQVAYQLGLVKDEKDFNKYLVDNDFANSIHIGSYQIKKDATYYEIAIAITAVRK